MVVIYILITKGFLMKYHMFLLTNFKIIIKNKFVKIFAYCLFVLITAKLISIQNMIFIPDDTLYILMFLVGIIFTDKWFYIETLGFKSKNLHKSIIYGLLPTIAFFFLYNTSRFYHHLNIDIYIDARTIYYILFISFIEELWFRGIILSACDFLFKPSNSIILTSLLFTFMHLNSSLVNMIYIFSINFIWTLVKYRTQNIYGCIISHAIINILSYLM